MKTRFLPGPVVLGVFLLLGGIGLCDVARAQDASAVWNSAERAAFDPAKTANVTNIEINLDRLRITLTSGTIQFSQPVNGRVFAAAFQGQGKLQITVPNAREGQQVKLFSNEDAVNLTFTEVAFNFSGDIFDQMAGKFTWNGTAAGNLENIYQDQMKQQDENGSPDTPRIVQSLLSTEGLKDTFFQAYVKTNDHGWMKASYDARDNEEIRSGRWIGGGYAGSFDTWLHFPAGGRPASEAFRDPLSKTAYAVDGYEIRVQLASDTELAATCEVKLHPRRSGDRMLLFGLNSSLRVDSVKDETGAALVYFQDRDPKDHYPHYGDFVAVALPAPLSPGEHTLTFHYAGKRVVRNVGSGNYFVPSYGWYPGNSVDFGTRVNFDLTFTYPKKFLLVATGDKASETSDGKETVSTWKNAKPLAVAGFAFGDYKVSTQKVGAIQVDAYVNRNQDDTLAAISQAMNSPLPSSSQDDLSGLGAGVSPLQTTAVGNLNPADLTKAVNLEMANTLKLFQEYYGAFPYDRVAVTNIPYSYGQGWPMLLFLSSFSFLDGQQQHTLGIKDQIGLTDFFRGHEMSHQWWGHRVGWKSYHDQWMSEGFAQFSGNLYVQFRESMGQYLDRIRLDKQELLSKNRFGHVNESLGPVWMGQRLSSSFAPDGYNVVIYDKGGLILHSLRMMMWDTQNADPDHNFKDMMKDFCQTYDNQAASTEDFKAIVEKHMLPTMDLDGNHRMDWFFSQYVYGTGVPEYKLNYTVKPSGGKWLVSGEMVQSGVPEGWKDIVRVYIQLPGKPQPIPTGWLRTGAKSSPFEFLLPAKPDKISLNSFEDTLVVIR